MYDLHRTMYEAHCTSFIVRPIPLVEYDSSVRNPDPLYIINSIE